MSGLFVAFEGGDGCGKSTQARRVAAARGAHFTYEPGDSPLGADLRRWLLDASAPMSPETEALLMLADRSHHVRSVIEPLRAAGTHVVSDRFAASTLAYQGYGRGVDLADLRAATELAIGTCAPDLTILLDVAPEVANARREPDRRDRFESQDPGFHDRVRQGYLEMAAGDDRWIVVEASGDLEAVSRAVDHVLDSLAWT
ncbi:MAG TPA: dTMP kinase [Acidimicrobiales bacterium]|nr:dTMP kinase [Acidimicrobiales bacterium]